jgi:nucleotide-binding universal stress UspA family protein
MYKHVLIPTDGSALSATAVENGMRFARDAGAKVTVVTVVEPFRVLSTDPEQMIGLQVRRPKRALPEAAAGSGGDRGAQPQ